LAQITAFTTKYLEENGGIFLKKQKREQHELPASSTVQDSHDVRESYHPHTVVFDSPGCENMLSKMKDTFEKRYKGSSIDLKHLDITSYLSAPNRINTCNKHLGTVYHICTGLCHMGYNKKDIQNTLLYNVATHNMNKIVEALDPETGKKIDDIEPKVLGVADWPVSEGLTVCAEYNEIFKDAENLIKYHSEVVNTVPSQVPEGYHTLRFQTENYDECTKSLSIFTQDELEFLEYYRWLRDIPDFFKTDDLLCVLNNTEVEKQDEQHFRDFEIDNEKPQDLLSAKSNAGVENEAEKKLSNFELDNESVRCPDASTLHALIPYVKRLVRLFPKIKEKVKEQLSSAQIRNKVYQHETKLNVTNITLDFNSGAKGIMEFLASDRQIWQLRMIDGDAWTGISKVYRVLQNTPSMANYFRGSQYTILKLKRLLMVNRMIKLNEILQSMQKPHLLMIACGTNQPVNDELRNMFQELFSALEQEENMKIILTTPSDGGIADFIQEISSETLGEGYITTDEQLTWRDLTPNSQTELLEKTVNFQGRRIALNQLISAKSMTNSFSLPDLLQEKEIRIGEKPLRSASRGYNEKYYIDRTFSHNIVIRQDILSAKKEGKFDDLLASNEQEFKELCQEKAERNVHWLVQEETGKLIWQQSQGNLTTLRKYMDVQKSHSYAPSDLDKLLQHAKQQRVMIIADKAGMGKTTVLTHLSKIIKENYPAHWLVRIDLNDYTELFEAQKVNKMDKRWVLEFVSKEVLKLESHLEKELFKKNFEGNEINKVVFMVDGFDEISPDYKETVFDMLQVLKQTSLEQLWVTTQPIGW
jgi:hypothetical protein